MHFADPAWPPGTASLAALDDGGVFRVRVYNEKYKAFDGLLQQENSRKGSTSSTEV